MRRRKLLILLFILIVVVITVIAIRHWRDGGDDENVLTIYGNVDVRQVDLGFRVGGRVRTMLFEEGDFVPKGKLMAFLDRQPYLDVLNQTKATVLAEEASLKVAETLLAPREILLGTGAIAKEDYDNALANRDRAKALVLQAEASRDSAQTNLNDTKIYAPSNGTILTRIREPGTIVREGDPIYTLSVQEPVWVRTYVSEPDLGKVYPGQYAEVFTDTPGSPIYKGHVGFISPVAEFTPKNVETTQLRTDLVYRLRVIANNPDRGLRQGMPVTVKLFLNQEEEK